MGCGGSTAVYDSSYAEKRPRNKSSGVNGFVTPTTGTNGRKKSYWDLCNEGIEISQDPYAKQSRRKIKKQHILAEQSTISNQLELYGYPTPEPPHYRKEQIFNQQEYIHIDQHVEKVPVQHMYSSYEDLTNYLTKPAKNDVGKVRALFKWVTSVDIAKLEASLEKLPDPETPLDYMLKIHWQMGNHAHLFTMLCRAADIPCLVIQGINKSAAYQLGQPVNRRNMGALWNAVLIDGEWRMVDVFWASTCVVGNKSSQWALLDGDDDGDVAAEDEEDEDGETLHHINEFFFLTDPDTLIHTHLPDDPVWQLLPDPITVKEYESRVYIRERFFELGMYMLNNSHAGCTVATMGGEVDVVLGLPKESHSAQFRYLLFRQRQKGDDVPNFPMDRFVFFTKTKTQINYHLQLPFQGIYKLDIYGENKPHLENFDLVCSYLIYCDSPKANVQPLPDVPDIGWGPGIEAEEIGLEPTSHGNPVIESEDGRAEIRFAMKNPMTVLQSLKHNKLNEWLLSKHAVIRVEDGELVINLRLPEKGEYAFQMYGDSETAEGELPNVCNYLIKALKGMGHEGSFPKLHESTLGRDFLAGKLDIECVSHEIDHIQCSDGRFTVTFKHGDGTELLCELDHNDIAQRTLADGVVKNKNNGQTEFNFDLPKSGEYAVNVFAKKNGDPSQIYHVHTFMVTAENGVELEEFASDDPIPKEAIGIQSVVTSDDQVDISIPLQENPVVAELRRRNAQDLPQKQIVGAQVEGSCILQVKLPELGEYKLEVFEQKPSGSLESIGVYQIIRNERDAMTDDISSVMPSVVENSIDPGEEERQRAAKALAARNRGYRDALKVAIGSSDSALIAQALKDCEANGIPDKGDLIQKGKMALAFIKHTEALSQAMSSRNLQQLEKAIAAAKKDNIPKLKLQIEMADRIAEQLRRIERLKHTILNLDQKTIAEIKSYSSPPIAVNKVMMATFLLLGDKEASLKDWKAIQVLIGKTGKQSLKRRILEFQVEDLDVKVAVRATEITGTTSIGDARESSAGAAAFYVWNTGMIGEAESRFLSNGGDLSVLKSKSKKK